MKDAMSNMKGSAKAYVYELMRISFIDAATKIRIGPPPQDSLTEEASVHYEVEGELYELIPIPGYFRAAVVHYLLTDQGLKVEHTQPIDATLDFADAEYPSRWHVEAESPEDSILLTRIGTWHEPRSWHDPPISYPE